MHIHYIQCIYTVYDAYTPHMMNIHRIKCIYIASIEFDTRRYEGNSQSLPCVLGRLARHDAVRWSKVMPSSAIPASSSAVLKSSRGYELVDLFWA